MNVKHKGQRQCFATFLCCQNPQRKWKGSEGSLTTQERGFCGQQGLRSVISAYVGCHQTLQEVTAPPAIICAERVSLGRVELLGLYHSPKPFSCSYTGAGKHRSSLHPSERHTESLCWPAGLLPAWAERWASPEGGFSWRQGLSVHQRWAFTRWFTA